MIDPTMFRQLTAIKHQERLEHYARDRRKPPAQQTTPVGVARRLQRIRTALLTHLNVAAGH
jgi:hypothetical protein